MISLLLLACNGGPKPSAPDEDGDGFTAAQGDCDEGEASVNPAAVEHCDEVDEDCDGLVDEDPVDAVIHYADADGDGFGGTAVEASCPSGMPSTLDDCDDAEPAVHPGAKEHCDGVDEDCDGDVDEGPADGDGWFPDADGDGAGAAAEGVTACAQPEG